MKKTILLSIIALFALNSCKPLNVQVKQKELKIINWNILYSFNHKRATVQGVDWIKRQNPDVLGLQELNGNTAASLKELAQKWGHKYSVILKEQGFPVGLTSKEPIEVIERQVKGFHHGYLHCKTFGINFFVVHFWPGKEHESNLILDKIRPLLAENEKVIVMGDFNSCSRKDKAFLLTKTEIKPKYEVIDRFETNGFIDLVHKHDKKALFSFGSPVLIPKWAKTIKELKSKQRRIDFILADKTLSKFSTSGTILLSSELDKISDHYPIVAKFRIPMKK